MHTRHLGPLTVSALGLGCMGMSEFYGPTDEAEGIATIHRALDLGVTLLDTADVYGPLTNEILVGKAIKGRRDGVVVATKFGIVRDPETRRSAAASAASPSTCGRRCEASLKRLGVDTIDLYYQHRIDRSTPIEETVGEMSRLVAGRQGPLPRPVRSVAGDARAGLRGPSRSPRSRPSSRCSTVSPSARSCRPAAGSASASSATARSDAACSAARSARPTT